MPLLPGARHDSGMRGEHIAASPAGAQHGLPLARRLAARLEHGPVAPVRPARQHHVHERGVIVAVGCGEL